MMRLGMAEACAEPRGRSWHGVAAVLVPATFVAALWLTTRPYFGIIGDARLYTVQALNALQDGRFASDIYFRFGSQDQYTLFSHFYAPLVAWLGVGHGALLGTILGQATWLAGCIVLVRTLTADPWNTLIVVATVIALPAQYGPMEFGEFFVSPRLFTEGLSMTALAVLLRGHRLWSLLILCLSAIVHPLPSLPALAIWFLYQVRRHPLWLSVPFVGLGVVVALCLAGVAPFTWLGETFDPAWFDIVRLRDPLCLLLAERWNDHLAVVTTILAAICTLMLTSGRDRYFLGAVLAVGVGGLAVSFLGGDLGHNVLVVDAQPWRAMWLLVVVSHTMAAIWLLRNIGRIRHFTPQEILLFAGLAMLLFTSFVPPVYCCSAATILAGCIVGLAGRGRPSSIMAYRVAWLVTVAAATTAMAVVALVFIAAAASRPEALWPEFSSQALTVLAAAGAWLLVTPPGPAMAGNGRRVGVLGAGAVVACAIAGWQWDQRTPWQRYVESGAAPRDFSDVIPQHASVYWDGGVELLWLGLDRPSYFSCLQGTGALFSRGTAMAYAQRRASFFPLKEMDFGDCREPDDGAPIIPRATDLAHACERETGLDYVILARLIPGVPSREWDAPVPLEVERVAEHARETHQARRFYIYSCANIRSSGTQAGMHSLVHG